MVGHSALRVSCWRCATLATQRGVQQAHELAVPTTSKPQRWRVGVTNRTSEQPPESLDHSGGYHSSTMHSRDLELARSDHKALHVKVQPTPTATSSAGRRGSAAPMASLTCTARQNLGEWLMRSPNRGLRVRPMLRRALSHRWPSYAARPHALAGAPMGSAGAACRSQRRQSGCAI